MAESFGIMFPVLQLSAQDLVIIHSCGQAGLLFDSSHKESEKRIAANQSSDVVFKELLSNDPLLEDMTTLLGTMTKEQTALFRRVVKGFFSLAMQQNGLVRHLEHLIRSERRQRWQRRPLPVQQPAPIVRTPIVLRLSSWQQFSWRRGSR